MKKYLLFLALTCAAVAQVSIDWADVDKTGSSLANLTTRSATDLTSGTLPDARFPATLPALSGVNLTALNASNIASGTLGAARLPALTLNFSGVLHTTPVTFTAGVATATLASQSANLIFAGPASGSAVAPTFRALVQADTQAATAATRNALASRAGVVVDGTASARVFATLTNQNIAADPVGVVIGFRAPSVAPASTFDIFGTSSSSTDHNQANALFCNIGNTGDLRVILKGATTNDSRSATVAGFVANYGGKPVILAAVRNGATMTVYINGSSVTTTETTAGNAPAWSTSLTTTYFGIGYRDSSAVTMGAVFYSATIYNLPLSIADVLEIYELGGAALERFKWGSQSARNTSNFGVGYSVGFDTFDGVSATGFHAIKTTTASEQRVSAMPYLGLVKAGEVIRVIYDLSITSGSAPAITLYYSSGVGMSSTVTATPGTNQVADVIAASTQSATVSPIFRLNAVQTGEFTVSNVRVLKLGAVVHLPLTDQLGFQARDASTNGLHAERTTTGTYWTNPLQSGRQTLTYTFAHSAISSTAATTTAFILPPNTVLREVQLNRTAAFDASTTLDIGISGTPTKFVTATNVVPTGFAQVTSSSLVPESATTNTTVYVKKNQATTIGSVTMNFIIEAVGSPTQ